MPDKEVDPVPVPAGEGRAQGHLCAPRAEPRQPQPLRQGQGRTQRHKGTRTKN